jgi:hypothetical protein
MGREPDYLAFMRGVAVAAQSTGLCIAGIRRRPACLLRAALRT